MSEALDIYVLDTSAWLTLIEDGAGAERIEELLDKARAGEIVVLVSFMSFMEVYYITMHERDRNEMPRWCTRILNSSRLKPRSRC